LKDDLPRLVLDALDQPILALSPDLRKVLLRNRAAARLFSSAPPPSLLEAAAAYVEARRVSGKPPPFQRTTIGERGFYLRVLSAPDAEIVLLSEEVLRDVDAYKLLNARNGVSRREYQVLTALRLGKTNRQIAVELGLAQGTVNVHVHHLLARFDVPDRAGLVRLIEEILRS
jgi:DNA-binding NarL/FixJ family response regulator